MIRFLAAFLMIVAGGYGTSVYLRGDFCRTDGDTVCYRPEDKMFKVENRSKITIALPSAGMRDWFIDQFYQQHPGHTVNFDFRIIENLSAQQALDLGVDVFYTDTHQAALLYDRLIPFDSRIVEHISSEDIEHFTEIINMEETFFYPFSYQGLLFVYNKTMLESLNFEISELTETNLPVRFSRWEDIIDLAEQWKEQTAIYNEKEVHVVFPFTLQERWQFYPFLTAGGWHMFDDNDATDPGFDDESFLTSLEFIADMGTVDWDHGKAPSSGWRYEKVVNEQISPFGLAGPWMFVDQIEELKDVDYVFSAFPTYKDQQLNPLVVVTGLIALENDAPSLTQEILRILTLPEATQAALDSTKKILVIPKDQIQQYAMSENRRQMSQAYMYSRIEPMVALPQNTSKLGFDFYLEADFMGILNKLYTQELSANDAQQQFIELYDTWLSENNR